MFQCHIQESSCPFINTKNYFSGASEDYQISDSTIDVTIPLQCLIRDSKLKLQQSSKVIVKQFLTNAYEKLKDFVLTARAIIQYKKGIVTEMLIVRR